MHKTLNNYVPLDCTRASSAVTRTRTHIFKSLFFSQLLCVCARLSFLLRLASLDELAITFKTKVNHKVSRSGIRWGLDRVILNTTTIQQHWSITFTTNYVSKIHWIKSQTLKMRLFPLHNCPWLVLPSGQNVAGSGRLNPYLRFITGAINDF